MRRQIGAFAIAASVLAMAGCETTTPPTTPPTEPSAPASPTGSVTASARAAGAGTIVVDDTLIALLPTEVGGVALTADAATAADIATDPALAGAVAGVAVATAFGAEPTDTGPDYVVVTLARLEPGVFDEAFFRDWRDSFDGAVCEQAGGVDGHAETEIAAHPTFIGTCVGGVRTYHVYLPASDVVVSMQGSGEGRYGERVIEGLTE